MVNTNNGVERQNKALKYDYLDMKKSKSLSQLLGTLVKKFFPDSYTTWVLCKTYTHWLGSAGNKYTKMLLFTFLFRVYFTPWYLNHKASRICLIFISPINYLITKSHIVQMYFLLTIKMIHYSIFQIHLIDSKWLFGNQLKYGDGHI